MSKYILTNVINNVGILTLNRPDKLNALNLEMIQSIKDHLSAWAYDPSIHTVVLQAQGEKMFCAGGDIKSVYDAHQKKDFLHNQIIFDDEYKINDLIKRYPKPYISLVDGLAFGGGLGLAMHGAYVIVTERALLAMPETKIGFFPDVGSMDIFARMPDYIGLYLALTGEALGPGDSLYTGLASHLFPSSKIEKFLNDLVTLNPHNENALKHLIDKHHEPTAPEAISDIAHLTRSCFHQDTLEALLEALNTHDSSLAKKTLALLTARSPTSLKVTFEYYQQAQNMSFKDINAMDYILSQNFLRSHDFIEGIRALLIEKDFKPQWYPANFKHLKLEKILNFFKSNQEIFS